MDHVNDVAPRIQAAAAVFAHGLPQEGLEFDQWVEQLCLALSDPLSLPLKHV